MYVPVLSLLLRPSPTTTHNTHNARIKTSIYVHTNVYRRLSDRFPTGSFRSLHACFTRSAYRRIRIYIYIYMFIYRCIYTIHTYYSVTIYYTHLYNIFMRVRSPPTLRSQDHRIVRQGTLIWFYLSPLPHNTAYYTLMYVCVCVCVRTPKYNNTDTHTPLWYTLYTIYV